MGGRESGKLMSGKVYVEVGDRERWTGCGAEKGKERVHRQWMN